MPTSCGSVRVCFVWLSRGIHYSLVEFTVCPPVAEKTKPGHTRGKPEQVTNGRIKQANRKDESRAGRYSGVGSSSKDRAYNVAW